MAKAKRYCAVKYDVKERPIYNDIVKGWVGFLTLLSTSIQS